MPLRENETRSSGFALPSSEGVIHRVSSQNRIRISFANSFSVNPGFVFCELKSNRLIPFKRFSDGKLSGFEAEKTNENSQADYHRFISERNISGY